MDPDTDPGARKINKINVYPLLSGEYKIIVPIPKKESFFSLIKHFTHLSLTILNLELDGDLEPLPVAGGLRDVVAYLLGRQAQGTHLHTHGVKNKERVLCWNSGPPEPEFFNF